MQSNGTLVRAGVLAVAAALALPAAATAQYVDVPRAPAYALQNVTVVQPDGQRTAGVTLVVRGELIEAMGRDVAVPADAEVLDGDSLMVYPGLVDGDGKASYDFPRPDIASSQVEIWNAPRALKGFMPSRRVVAYLSSDGEDVASERKAGIVAAAVHPKGAMMSGRGTLLLYRKGAALPDQLVVTPALGPSFAFQGGRGVYPGTLFGVMAFIRQSFEDARHREAVERAYDDDPRGLTTPAYDADYAVLQEVLDDGLPVYFQADGAADILRVVGLADEYGFRPVIVGGAEAWKVADALKQRDIPVLVSVDFPEPRRWDPEDSAAVLDAAAAREKDGLEARYANAGRLVQSGVTVALTSGGTGKILDGARKTVEYGLSPDAALAALTSTPAQLLGVPELARLGAGMPATFVVASGPLLEPDTRVTYTFVEGRKEDGAKPGAKAGSAEDAVDFAGEWQMSLDSEGQAMDAVLRIEQEGATFTGTLSLQGMDARIREGTINGAEISAVAVMEQGGQSMEIKITGTVEGDSASGEADAGPLGVARWTAKRTGPGGAR